MGHNVIFFCIFGYSGPSIIRLGPSCFLALDAVLSFSHIVEALREPLRGYCADLSTSVKFDTEVDQSILISFLEGAKAGAHWGRHIS